VAEQKGNQVGRLLYRWPSLTWGTKSLPKTGDPFRRLCIRDWCNWNLHLQYDCKHSEPTTMVQQICLFHSLANGFGTFLLCPAPTTSQQHNLDRTSN